MTNTNETIADIIAWLRRPREGENGYLTAWRDEIADRLEAAYKREKAAIEADALSAGGLVEAMRKKKATAENSSAVGNAAKLRDALGNIRAELWNNTVIAGKRKFELYEIADAALAEPPRNCDLHTADELKVIFKSELVSELPIANEHEKNLITITAMRMIDTLFATTKEGGNDGNE